MENPNVNDDFNSMEEDARGSMIILFIVFICLVLYIAIGILIYHCGYTQGIKKSQRQSYIAGYMHAWQQMPTAKEKKIHVRTK